MRLLRTRKRRTGRADGFTMIELLMTMLILTIVLLGLAALQVGTIRRVTASRRANEATRLSQSLLERYRHINCAALPGDTMGTWIVAVRKTISKGDIQMANVAVDTVNPGPYTVWEWVEDTATDKTITIRASWTSQERESTGDAKVYSTAVSLRRLCP
jgi:prepilin-type N-terminal cleavage/methylation domain-containing protein